MLKKILSVCISLIFLAGLAGGSFGALEAAQKTAVKTVQKKSTPKKPIKSLVVNKKSIQKKSSKKIPPKPPLKKEELPIVIIPPRPIEAITAVPAPKEQHPEEVAPQTAPLISKDATMATTTQALPQPPTTPSSTPGAAPETTTENGTSTPGHEKPFIVFVETSPNALLTRDGTFQWTNTARTTNSTSSALIRNEVLDAIANLRLKDMFDKQYFEHVSPTGESAGTIAKTLGFKYVSIGENIALGNFKDDPVLVGAWMKSPGHRANILRSRYTDLGVAVGKGTYEGKEQWIGVQIFGTPLSICPQPAPTMKQDIESKQIAVQTLVASAASLKAKLSSSTPQTQEEVNAYNAIVNDHNALVDQIHRLNAILRDLITAYNSDIDALNTCIAKVTGV